MRFPVGALRISHPLHFRAKADQIIDVTLEIKATPKLISQIGAPISPKLGLLARQASGYLP